MAHDSHILLQLLGFLGLGTSAGSLGLYWYQARLADAIEDTPRSMAAEITRPGGYHEVQGEIECATPLDAPCQAGSCVWYRYTIIEDYEEKYASRNGTRTREVSQTVLDRSELVGFTLRDESGGIRVDPAGAHLDGKTVRGGTDDMPGTLRTPEIGLASSRRLKGRRKEVQLIPVDGPGYVLGRCVARDGTLVLTKDDVEGRPFVVSCRSERELMAGHELGLKAKLALAVAGAVVGGASLFAAWGG